MPEWREFGDALRGHDRWRLKEFLKAVDLVAVDLEAVDPQAVDPKTVDREGGAMGAETVFLGSLVFVGMHRIE